MPNPVHDPGGKVQNKTKQYFKNRFIKHNTGYNIINNK